MKKAILIYMMIISHAYGQGYNHQWLLGYWWQQDPKGRMLMDSNNYSLITEYRKMQFYGTQANISDANGNLLMSSNGVWIANALNDTMMNGSGLNPGGITPNWPFGLPMTYNNIILPYPGDSNKYILFHHSADWDGISYPAYEIYYSVVDMLLDNSLGGINSNQKNITVISDTLNWGLAACKHANGRDWWITAQKFNSDIIFTILLTPFGIANISTQHLNIPVLWYNVTQATFSQNGTKFGMAYSSGGTVTEHFLYLFDFNRCTGIFSNPQIIDLSIGGIGWGLAFSPSGKYVYACSSNYIFQIDTDNQTVDTVAVYDGFISPPGFTCCATTFWNMYLAANGKIYITSGSGVQHLHEMNYPDSAGAACDVQQHAINLGYAQLRSVPNHPNYYLGCDTTLGCTPCYVGIEEQGKHDFKFSIMPNPSNGIFKIIYLLPQNKNGTLEIFDINGRKVYEQRLPPWSTMQQVRLPEVKSGMYSCIITSGNERVVRKVVVVKE